MTPAAGPGGTSLPPPTTIRHLDALRALAVLLVILFHWRLLAIGWIGVSIFFVISGFLITRILLRAREGAALGPYLALFYARRALRIVPIYWLYVGLWSLAAATGLFVASDWAPAALWTWLFNYVRWAPDYEGSRIFTHLWSLSVEEQFYLVYPLVVYALRGPRLGRLLVALVLLSPLLRLIAGAVAVMVSGDPLHAGRAVAVATFLHLDAFALGGLLALGEARILALPARRFAALAGATALAIIVIVALNLALAGAPPPAAHPFFTGPTSLGLPVNPFHDLQPAWSYSLVNLLGALLIALVLRGLQRPVAALAPLDALGRISYGIYLYHFALISVAERLFPGVERLSLAGAGVFAAYLAAVIALAALSWRLVERPCLALKPTRWDPRGWRRPAWAGRALPVAAALLLGAGPASAAGLQPPAWLARPVDPTAAPAACAPVPAPLASVAVEVPYRRDAAFDQPDPAVVERYKAAVAPLHAYQHGLTEQADRWQRTGDAAAAACALAWLDRWAAGGAMLGAMAMQGRFEQKWHAATLCLVRLRLTGAPLDAAVDGRVRAHLAALGAAARAGNHADGRPAGVTGDDDVITRSNHAYWAGLAAAACGVAADRSELLDWGTDQFRMAMRDVTPDGFLPLELKRGARALGYHGLSLDALLMIAELAAANGRQPYDAAGDALRRLVARVARGYGDPVAFATATGKPQDLAFARAHLSWTELYAARFGADRVEGLRALRDGARPLRLRWLGGDVTLVAARVAPGGGR